MDDCVLLHQDKQYMKEQHAKGNMGFSDIHQVVASYNAHLSHGHTYKLRKKALSQFVLRREVIDNED